MDGLTLFAVGFGAATCLWLGLVWFPRRLAPAEALRAFAAERGLPVRGDGLAMPLTLIGAVRGRTFTVTWQRHWVGGDMLLVGVDCDTAADGVVRPPAPAGDTAPGPIDKQLTIAGDAALVTRWIRPAPDVLAPAQLTTILEALATLAEELEAAAPEEDADHEHA